ncbi:MAG: GNAT family N-acetyltransferase [Anaerolineae bacterium]|nr:GNAT family N-acetyltransferase [Anaerolineae bacterium]
MRLVPASQFTIEELVAAYNQTRVDYIVPMPMNAARLREYIHNYDIVLEMSAVAVEDNRILGLAMLGVRSGHTWITRLGVLPARRRRGTGRCLMEHLIVQSRCLRVRYVTLDVIKNNVPAEQLFHELGFREVRELLVIRRPPGPSEVRVSPYRSYVLDHQQAVRLLQSRRSIPSWLDEETSLVNAGNLAALRIEQVGGARGWIVYQETALQLGRLVLQTEVGDPYQVGSALLHALHAHHPTLDAKCENMPVDDPHWPAMQETGYLESFRRVEMHLQLGPFA